MQTIAAPIDQDPYLWLEDIDAPRSLDWVSERNASATAALGSSYEFALRKSAIKEVLDSDDKIPLVSSVGGYLYNFWRDADHPRGVWRRTTDADYRSPDPTWETLLDIDALATEEDIPWVFHGAEILRPTYDRAIISLSRGGSDADEDREFDLTTKTFVTPDHGGFFRPESKGGMSWIDRDTVYIFTDFGTDELGNATLTSSGYPRIVKQLSRGQQLNDATVVYAGGDNDMYIRAFHSHTPGWERDFVARSLAFYRSELYLRTTDGLTLIDVPLSAEAGVHREWLLIETREPWVVGDTTYPAGALLITRFEDYLAGGRDLTVLFEPTSSQSLAGASFTKNHLVLNVLDHVKNRVEVLTPPTDRAGSWERRPAVALPAMGTTSVSGVDSDVTDDVWVMTTDYLTPSSLYRLAVDDLTVPGGLGEPLKTSPSFFDSSGLTIDQYFATSEDGTQVPYFLVHATDAPRDGSIPTLLYGYGGFEISLTPGYSGGLGRAWLGKGGAYAVANIRGGGEYGPRWHQSALKDQRHKAYEDFAAVARDLVERGVTTPERLGMQGGSNGGLLTGNMYTQYPELFGAVVIQVPLLDMKRYSHLLAGASWMAEYGDPDDPAQWEFIQRFSPYHLVEPNRNYPPVLITTSTRDDRVHPGHARKFAAKLLDYGYDVTYYENIEGGHGGAADNDQAAFMSALAYEFLWQRLTPVTTPDGDKS